MTMVWEHRFRLPQTSCSNMEAVSQFFSIVLRNLKPEAKACFKYIVSCGYIRREVLTSWGKLFSILWIFFMTFLVWGLVEARGRLS